MAIHFFDFAIIVIHMLFMLKGYHKGMAITIFEIFLLIVLLLVLYYGLHSPLFLDWIRDSKGQKAAWKVFIAFVTVILGFFLISKGAGLFFNQLLIWLKLKVANQALGAVFGFFVGYVILSALYLGVSHLNFFRSLEKKSDILLLYKLGSDALSGVSGVLDYNSFQDQLKSMIEKTDQISGTIEKKIKQ